MPLNNLMILNNVWWWWKLLNALPRTSLHLWDNRDCCRKIFHVGFGNLFKAPFSSLDKLVTTVRQGLLIFSHQYKFPRIIVGWTVSCMVIHYLSQPFGFLFILFIFEKVAFSASTAFFLKWLKKGWKGWT